MLLIILLGVWTLQSTTSSPLVIDVALSEDGPDLVLDDSSLWLDTFEPTTADELLSVEDLAAALDPLATLPELDTSAIGLTPSINFDALSVGVALRGREAGMKKMLLAQFGGTAATEAAVQRGLEWLVRNQRPDGTWSLRGPYSDGGGVENRCAATAMALLAFQGAGNTHQTGQHKSQMLRGITALLKMQNKNGDFYTDKVEHQHLYSQAQASIAVCELLGMTQDIQLLRQPAQRAIDFAVQYQAPEGGWRYTPGRDSDTSVTGWFVMALQSGLMAGLDIPQPTLENVNRYLNSVQEGNGSRYAYVPRKKISPAMTAEGLLCRQYLGWDRDDARLVSGVRYLLANPIDWKRNQDVYYWYYATQVTHHMEGEYWEDWNEVMRDVIPKNQVLTGRERGSWDPRGDRWGGQGGRLYTTCLCIYMLEVYYRHLPIYQYRKD